MKLYEINEKMQRYLEAAFDQDTGEVLSEEAMEEYLALEEEREQKIESIFLLFKAVSAEAEAVGAERKKLQEREKALKNKAQSLKEFGTKVLAGEKFKTSRVNVSYRKNDRLVVSNDATIPPEYLKQAEPTIDILGLKRAIKTGAEYQGITIEQVSNIQIK